MTLFWIVVVPLLIVVAVTGAVSYRMARKPAEDELERAFWAESAVRTDAQRLPIDRSRL